MCVYIYISISIYIYVYIYIYIYIGIYVYILEYMHKQIEHIKEMTEPDQHTRPFLKLYVILGTLAMTSHTHCSATIKL